AWAAASLSCCARRASISALVGSRGLGGGGGGGTKKRKGSRPGVKVLAWPMRSATRSSSTYSTGFFALASTARRGVAPATPGGAPSVLEETPESLSGRRYQPLSR